MVVKIVGHSCTRLLVTSLGFRGDVQVQPPDPIQWLRLYLAYDPMFCVSSRHGYIRWMLSMKLYWSCWGRRSWRDLSRPTRRSKVLTAPLQAQI